MYEFAGNPASPRLMAQIRFLAEIDRLVQSIARRPQLLERLVAGVAEELDEGNVVFLVPDGGWKYLSSGIYTQPLDDLGDLDATNWW